MRMRTAAVAFSGFVVLGLPTGMLGIAWPTIRTALDAPLAGLGVLLAAMTITQFGASGLSGLIRDRFGTVALLLVPTVLAAGGLALFAIATTWPAMIAAALLFVYVGIELGAGQWSFTRLTADGAVTDTIAGLAVFLYWAALAGGRVALAIFGDRVRPARLFDLSVGGALASAVAYWVLPPAVARSEGRR